METTARLNTVGNATAWFAYRGNKVLCGKRIIARRFKTADAALKVGQAADDREYY